MTVLVGTRKGGFLLRSGPGDRWQLEGPLFKGWKVTASTRFDGRYLVATASEVYGPALHSSSDLRTWEQLAEGPRYREGGPRRLREIWTLAVDDGSILAGVDEAGVFRGIGERWDPLDGLNDHPTRPRWFPGAGGLCAHSLLGTGRRLWCGISAVGVFRSDDGGRSWISRNQGVTVTAEDPETDEVGYCVHGLAHDPGDPDRIYRQDHRGVYRTLDGGDSWERIEEGLPSAFGFPMVLDRSSGHLFVAPLESDEYRMPPDGRLRLFRSTDRGDSWHEVGEGLPDGFYGGVLRGAAATDHRGGVYVGTTSGTLHLSLDGGDGWRTLPWVLPRVLHVAAYPED